MFVLVLFTAVRERIIVTIWFLEVKLKLGDLVAFSLVCAGRRIICGGSGEKVVVRHGRSGAGLAHQVSIRILHSQ